MFVYEIIAFSFPGLLAKKAVACGLSVSPYIKTSLSPGSGVVTYYLKESGVLDPLAKLGYNKHIQVFKSSQML